MKIFKLFIISVFLLSSGCVTSDDVVVPSWTYITLDSNFSTTNASSSDVGINFTPIPNKKYEVEIQYMVKTTDVIVGPRPGFNWSSNLSDGAGYVQSPALQTTVIANCEYTVNCLSPIGGLDFTNKSYLGIARAIFETLPNATGTFEVTLASETEGVEVMMTKGSFIKYKVYN